MDYSRALMELYTELEKLKRVIPAIEGLLQAQGEFRAARSRRGRKSMPPEEPEAVSARMKAVLGEEAFGEAEELSALLRFRPA